MIKVAVIFGTRPEVIKLAPLIKSMEAEKGVSLDVCFTGQHKEMVLPLLDFFKIKVNSSLDLMQQNQTLLGLSSRALAAMEKYLTALKPAIVFVQGDTTTAMCAAMAAFYNKIKIGHVEAGLRTHDIYSPFPEEFNRQVISKIADIHFAPTEAARQNLLKENISSANILVTGNTVIDALLYTKERLQMTTAIFAQQPWYEGGKKFILITGHRRENFGKGFENICYAIKELAGKYPTCDFVYPVHLNPNVQVPVNSILAGISNVYLIPPVDYVQFVSLMSRCYFIITDSGGVQEEAPSLGKPVLIMRTSTERDEVVKAGAAILVGTDKEKIISNASRLLEDETLYKNMSAVKNPFGDGKAAERIVHQTLAALK